MPLASGWMNEFLLFQEFEDLSGLYTPKFFTLCKGEFEQRAFHMVKEDFQVIGIDQPVFGGTPEEKFRVLNYELIERGTVGHQERRRGSSSAARSSCPLPGGSNSTRITSHNTYFQSSNIHTQLQGVGRYDPQDLPFTEALL